MARIKFIADTGADIPEDIVEKYDLTIFPFMSIFGDKMYKSGVGLSGREFFKKLEEFDGIPTTSQTPYFEMEDALKKYSAEYDAVIVFTLSSKASGQHNSLQAIRRNLLEENPELDIRIIDTMSFTIGIGMAVVYAAELALKGESVDEVERKAKEYIKSWDMYFLVDNLAYLEKGGRINKTSAMIGTLLDIKPVLSIRDGLIESVDKFRGKKKLVKKLVDKVKQNPEFDSENPQFGIVHASDEWGEELKELLNSEFDNPPILMYTHLGAIIGTHTGPGVIAVFFRKK